MNRKDSRKVVIIVLFFVCVSIGVYPYVVRTGNDLGQVSWPVESFPLVLQVWEGFTDALPNMIDGSRPKVAIAEALERWARNSAITVIRGADTSIEEAGLDSHNVITAADTVNNRNLVGSALGVSQGWTINGQSVETDVVFNPGQTFSTIETDDINISNLLDVASHELGHSWNLVHTLHRSATMATRTSGFNFEFNRLSWDEVAGLSALHPLVGLDQITGSISGMIRLGGLPAFGAFVFAVDAAGAIAGNSISLPDGSYNIGALPPGDYTVYAEPLDGSPMQAFEVGGPLFNSRWGEIATNFLPTFYQGSMAPNVTVASDTSGIDIDLTPGVTTLSPAFSGFKESLFGAFSVSGAPVQSNRGINGHVIVMGDGVEKLVDNQGVFFLGPNLATGQVAVTDTSGTPFKFFPITIPPGTPTGAYSIFLRSSDEVGVMSGILDVFRQLRYLQAFAQFAHIPGAATAGLFLINTNLQQAAQGRISARSDEGTPSAISLGSLQPGGGNELNYNLPPGGVVSARTGGSSQFIGSLRASAGNRIGGTVLFETAFGTTGVGPSRPLYTFVAPITRDTVAGTDTGFAITNLDERPVRISIQIRRTDGTLVGSTVIELAGNGHIARFIPELVSATPNQVSGTAVVTANRLIGATVIRTAPGIFTTFPVIQNRASFSSFYAQFAHFPSAQLTSQLILVNPSPFRTAVVEVRVRNSNGNPSAVVLNGQTLADGTTTVTLPPLGSVVLQTGGSNDLVGSVEVTAEPPFGNGIPVGGVVLFSSPAVGTAGVGESFPLSRTVIPLERDASEGTDTGIAIVNPQNRTLTVRVTVRDSGGNIVAGPKDIPLSALNQLARFPNEAPLALGLPSDFVGSLWVEVTEEGGKVALTVIRQSPGVLTTFPAVSLEEPVTPAN